MISKTTIALLTGSLLFASPAAYASDVESACLSSVERNGVPEGMTQSDVEGACSCLAASVSGDVEAEIMALAELSAEEVQAQRSEAAGEAIDACFGG